jgi:uncharacterized protein (DUF1501 family)
MDRRYFLKSSGIALASLGIIGTAPKFFQSFAAANVLSDKTNGKRKTLVTIFQRGAVDGLNMVVPYGDSNYYERRPTINIPKPGNGQDAALNLDGFFALHPAMTGMKSLWDKKQLAIVHAVGSPDNTRSHFDAQDYMEAGTPGNKGTKDGWLNRYLQTNADPKATPFRAVSITQQIPRSLLGRSPAVAMTNLNDFAIRAGSYTQNVQGGFEGMYEEVVTGKKSDNDVLKETGAETFEAVNFLKKVNPSQYKPENGARYPQSQFGNSLLQIAQLIKAGVGLEVAFAESGGWDTHSNEGNARGQLANLLRDFSNGITAFVTDLGSQMDDVVILTMSEFGRTVRENGTRGTDHGHATAMFAIGNAVKGGKVYGQFPGLSSGNLYEGRDLALTTDFRDMFAEVSSRHLGAKDLQKIFPGYAVNKSNFKGLI